jgi:type IV secretory pathway VirJ component
MLSARQRLLMWVSMTTLSVIAITLALGGYWDSAAEAFTATPAQPGRPKGPPPLAAIFWSGDMGMRVGFGSDLPDRLAARGVPVLAMTTPVLFGSARDRPFARAAVAASLKSAIERSGAQRVALVGFSFGADVLAATVGGLEPALRRRIASLVLVGPGTDVYFHANPFGIFYRGPSEADPAHMVASLRGMRLSCIFAAQEVDSLCREPAFRGARIVSVPDGHLMLAHRAQATDAVIAAVLHPAEPLP